MSIVVADGALVWIKTHKKHIQSIYYVTTKTTKLHISPQGRNNMCSKARKKKKILSFSGFSSKKIMRVGGFLYFWGGGGGVGGPPPPPPPPPPPAPPSLKHTHLQPPRAESQSEND